MYDTEVLGWDPSDWDPYSHTPIYYCTIGSAVCCVFMHEGEWWAHNGNTDEELGPYGDQWDAAKAAEESF